MLALFFPKIWSRDTGSSGAATQPADDEKKRTPRVIDAQFDSDLSDNDSISSDAQSGVKKIEAITSVWSRLHLIAAYVFIWIYYFVSSMQQGMSNGLMPYVTSSFRAHSLTATTSVMSSLIGGLVQLPLAKILDIWGRPQGFALMVFLLTIGLIMMAACNNVKTYAAAQVFYWVGYNGSHYALSIFVADTSSLRNRGLMFAFVSSPYIATTWIGGPLATAFLNGPGFRWGFGTFAIIEPLVTLPIFALFVINCRKAKAAGFVSLRKSGRTLWQSLKHYAIEFDLAGLLLIIAGLALFLLPFSLYSYQSAGWQSPMIISMIVIGGLLVVAFGFYEKYIAPTTFIPFCLLTDRTVLGACILSAALFISFYIWNAFFYSFLQVVQGLSITEALYVTNIYSIGSCFWAIVVGFAIRWTGRFKWVALYFGLPINILGGALMIYFRRPDQDIGYIVMCQIFIALGGGALVICEQLAAMAATTHQYIAVVIALEGMFSNVGGAIGDSVASALWNGLFPHKLLQLLPPQSKSEHLTIYEDLTVQLSYPMGSPTRSAINEAYGYAQKHMCIASTAIGVISIISVIVWRDIDVKKNKQVAGRVW